MRTYIGAFFAYFLTVINGTYIIVAPAIGKSFSKRDAKFKVTVGKGLGAYFFAVLFRKTSVFGMVFTRNILKILRAFLKRFFSNS